MLLACEKAMVLSGDTFNAGWGIEARLICKDDMELFPSATK